MDTSENDALTTIVNLSDNSEDDQDSSTEEDDKEIEEELQKSDWQHKKKEDGKSEKTKKQKWNEDWTILDVAERGKLPLVRQFVKACPDLVYVTDPDGYTPLHRACYNNRLDVVKYLIENNANVCAPTVDGWHPIHCASQWGHVQVVKVLLSSGADINARTNGQLTPLILAASRPKNRALIEYLLFHDDVDVWAKNEAGDTAFDISKRNSTLYKLWDLL